MVLPSVPQNKPSSLVVCGCFLTKVVQAGVFLLLLLWLWILQELQLLFGHCWKKKMFALNPRMLVFLLCMIFSMPLILYLELNSPICLVTKWHLVSVRSYNV